MKEQDLRLLEFSLFVKAAFGTPEGGSSLLHAMRAMTFMKRRLEAADPKAMEDWKNNVVPRLEAFDGIGGV